MGKASRGRERQQRKRREAGAHRVRAAERADAEPLRALLELVGFEDPSTPARYALALSRGDVPALLDATVTVLVVDDGVGGLLAAATLTPPGQLVAVADSPQTYGQILSRVVELEAVVVREDTRGQKLGRQLVDAAVVSSRARGFRLMTAGFETSKEHLATYYAALGFTVLAPGAPVCVRMPDRRVGVVPAEPNMRQIWLPLSPQVARSTLTTPEGVWEVLENVLA